MVKTVLPLQEAQVPFLVRAKIPRASQPKRKQMKDQGNVFPVLAEHACRVGSAADPSILQFCSVLESTEWEQEGRLTGRGGEHPEASRRGWEFGWGLKDGWQGEKSRQEVPLTWAWIQKAQGMANIKNNMASLRVVTAGGVGSGRWDLNRWRAGGAEQVCSN